MKKNLMLITLLTLAIAPSLALAQQPPSGGQTMSKEQHLRAMKRERRNMIQNMTPEQRKKYEADRNKAKEEVRAAVNKRAGRAPGATRAKSSPAENGVTFAVPVPAPRVIVPP